MATLNDLAGLLVSNQNTAQSVRRRLQDLSQHLQPTPVNTDKQLEKSAPPGGMLDTLFTVAHATERDLQQAVSLMASLEELVGPSCTTPAAPTENYPSYGRVDINMGNTRR